MTTAVTAASSDPSAPAALVCTHCGYSLIGLDLAGACPECGHAVAESLQICSSTDQVTRALRSEAVMASTVAVYAAEASGLSLFATVSGAVHMVTLFLISLILPLVLWRVMHRPIYPGLLTTRFRSMLPWASIAVVAAWALWACSPLLNWIHPAAARLVALPLTLWMLWLAFLHLRELAGRLGLADLARDYRRLAWTFSLFVAAWLLIPGLAMPGTVAWLILAAVSVGLFYWKVEPWERRTNQQLLDDGGPAFAAPFAALYDQLDVSRQSPVEK